MPRSISAAIAPASGSGASAPPSSTSSNERAAGVSLPSVKQQGIGRRRRAGRLDAQLAVPPAEEDQRAGHRGVQRRDRHDPPDEDLVVSAVMAGMCDAFE